MQPPHVESAPVTTAQSKSQSDHDDYTGLPAWYVRQLLQPYLRGISQAERCTMSEAATKLVKVRARPDEFERTRNYLKAARYPVRAGMHSNSAFALTLALDYARACDDRAFADAICDKARSWFGRDADCPAWEPDGEDFRDRRESMIERNVPVGAEVAGPLTSEDAGV